MGEVGNALTTMVFIFLGRLWQWVGCVSESEVRLGLSVTQLVIGVIRGRELGRNGEC